MNQCKVHPYEINLLSSLLQETNHLDNMNFTTGPNPDSPAITMDGSYSIYVDNTSLTFQKQLHNYSCSKEKFVVHASVKFDGIADGPIFFLHTNNMIFLSLEVEVDSIKGGNIKVSFVHDGGMRAISFPYNFTNLTRWHNISVIFNGMLVSLYVNCEKVADQVVMQPDYCLPEDVRVTIGSNPQNTEVFKGSMQDLIISFKEDAIIKQCPKAHIDCRFSADYQTLTNTISTMMRDHEQEVNQLREALNSYLDHRTYSCFIDGRQFEYGTFIQIDDKKICYCSLGGTEKCYTMVDMIPKESIPSSTETCTADGKIYSVGDLHYVTYDDGLRCRSQICEEIQISANNNALRFTELDDYVCDDALRVCSNAFTWSEHERQAAQCCGFCTACEMQNDCQQNTICLENNRGGYSCECDTGFFPDDDGSCKDINECDNGHRNEIGYHSCPSDEACINTFGSFTCKCPEGYQLNSNGNQCEDIDECSDYPDACPTDFICKNTRGSYICECNTGYERDGNQCIPQCNPPCNPEGRCVEPNVCACPSGLQGNQCEIDVNECQSYAGCSPNATCINFHGGYFCRCNDGYYGNGRACYDINECTEGTHTCPSGSTCQNTEGSYQCICPAGDCKDGCVHRKEPYPNNSVRYKGSKKCSECTCNNGLWTCENLQCNCSLPDDLNNPCCPQCQEESCTVDGHEFDHNQEFIHPSNPCELCICKRGQEECTDTEPSFTCPVELVRTSKDGCRNCAVDECTLDNEGVTMDVNSSCSVCVCKDGEWTCDKKEVDCPTPLCNPDQVITIGCCPVCVGTSTDPQAQAINDVINGDSDNNDSC